MKTYVLILRQIASEAIIDEVVYASSDYTKLSLKAKEVALVHGFEQTLHGEHSASYQEVYYERFTQNKTAHFIVQEYI